MVVVYLGVGFGGFCDGPVEPVYVYIETEIADVFSELIYGDWIV